MRATDTQIRDSQNVWRKASSSETNDVRVCQPVQIAHDDDDRVCISREAVQ